MYKVIKVKHAVKHNRNPIISIKSIKKSAGLYLIFLPVIIYYVVFHYVPIYGLQIAFKDYIPIKGFAGSKWIGFEHFQMFFNSPDFFKLLYNTVSISLYQLLAGFPAPILLALMLNEAKNLKFKKLVQTVTYAPHFISVVVMSGIIITFLSPSTGIINFVLSAIGIDPINFLANEKWFKTIFVFSGIWQNAGWGAIIYIAALTSIDVNLYSAAEIDGCNRLQRIWYIDIPGIMPTAITMFILNVGRVMNVGYQKILLLQNPLNISASDVIQTYVYRIGLANGQFDFATAVGLFNNVVNLVLLLLVNRISRKVTETSLW